MLADLRGRLEQGQSEEQIFADYEALYGAGIYALPSTEGASLLAWILPVVGLVIGGLLVWIVARRLRPSEGEQSEGESQLREEVRSSQEYREKLAKELRDI